MKRILSVCLCLLLCFAALPAFAEAGTTEIPEDLTAMIPAIDSVLRSVSYEENFHYDPANPQFFWTALYLMGVNWGLEHPLGELDEDWVTLPRQAVQEFATALFFDYDDLLPIPETLMTPIFYNEDTDRYHFAGSDKGDSETVIDEYTHQGDGTIALRASLRGSEGEVLDSIDLVLVDNPYADGITDPIFLYSIRSVEMGEQTV